MARLSKSHHFKIFQDSGIPTPPSDETDPFNDAEWAPTSTSHHESLEHDDHDPPSDADDEAPSRESLTSISTFPESQPNDTDDLPASASPQKLSTPHLIRPSFRRPESVRRMQLSSPRQSLLTYHRSPRSGTPISDFGRGSPRGRRRMVTEEMSLRGEEEVKEHPLVLLHVTLLPVVPPWSMESMHDLLPEDTVANLMLLRSKVSETVAQRGVLISHPREEYEMLEERLLEALELREERLTKCGHFRGRMSDASQSSDGKGSDSGLGSSGSSSEDGDFCSTCQHHIRCMAGKKQKWSVKVFAANGLMRSSAWAAAWQEMESVDVEILPWIGEEDRRKLDRMRDEEERHQVERLASQEAATRTGMEMGLLPAHHESKMDEAGPETIDEQAGPDMAEQHTVHSEFADSHDLPPVYGISQIPLSTLLRNYIFLLAQDRRNMTMFFVGLIVVYFAARSTFARLDTALVPSDYQAMDFALSSTVGENEPADAVLEDPIGVAALA